MARLTELASGLVANDPTATSAISSATTAGSPGPGDPRTRAQRSVVQQQREQRHSPDAPQRAEAGAEQHVVVLGVGQLVGDDHLDLGRRRLRQEVVVDDDPPGAAEPGDVGVEGRRAPRGVGDEDLVDVHALPVGQPQDGGAERPVRHRRELVEQGLHDHRVERRTDHRDDHGRRAGPGEPVAAGSGVPRPR